MKNKTKRKREEVSNKVDMALCDCLFSITSTKIKNLGWNFLELFAIEARDTIETYNLLLEER